MNSAIYNFEKEENFKPVLFGFLMYFTRYINEQKIIAGTTAQVDLEFTVCNNTRPGRNPSTDVALVVFYDEYHAAIPLILYKLKRAVHPEPGSVVKADLIELLIQS